MLKNRLFSFVILIGIIFGVIFVDWLTGVFVTIFIAFSLYEFFTMLEKKGLHPYKYVGILIGVIIPLSMVMRFELTKSWELLFAVVLLLFLFLMQFRRRKNQGAVVDISTTIFGILYVSWFFSFLIKIRYLPGGLGLLGAVLLITKSGDIGAYLVGSRFGKTPFVPRISPKKTVEGVVGGLIFSCLGALISRPFLNVNTEKLILLGLLFGVLGQLGDLSESLLKRDCGVKDSGKILPGMGGVLDEIDSLIFTAPVFYFYMNAILNNGLIK
ncbi:MAG: phosphatidate cytidylyltransferase [Candidatus Omnitrophica bacterium]|nr:phosphatidate cytidylyltransferase [Candidatus Omnitrophota bacterium]